MDHGEDVKAALESFIVTGVSDDVILLSLGECTYLKRQKDLALGKRSCMFWPQTVFESMWFENMAPGREVFRVGSLEGD